MDFNKNMEGSLAVNRFYNVLLGLFKQKEAEALASQQVGHLGQSV